MLLFQWFNLFSGYIFTVICWGTLKLFCSKIEMNQKWGCIIFARSHCECKLIGQWNLRMTQGQRLEVPSGGCRYHSGNCINPMINSNTLLGWGLFTSWPYLTFLVDTLVQSSQCRHQFKSTGAFLLRPNGPECRYNIQVLPTRVR